MKTKVSEVQPTCISSSTDNCLEFIPPDEQADIKDVDDGILTIQFLFTEANTSAPSEEELTDASSERGQSEDEESESDIFSYQSISKLIAKVGNNWDEDGDDGTEWLRGITISQVQEEPGTDDISPQASLIKEDGPELSTAEVDVKMDPSPNTDDIVSQISDDDQEEEEEYFGDDEKEGPKGSKFIIGPIPPISNKKHEDDDDDEKNSFKSTEIVLSPEYLNLNENPQPSPSSPGSQIPRATPKLTRKLSFSNKIIQTLQRNLPTPGKNVDIASKINKKSKKENIKIILY